VIVCHCNAVSDREVRAVADHGAADVDEVARLCGAGGNCGGCWSSIEDVLAECPVRILTSAVA
jgi:bacterioferritin-associated ferredoxin